MCLWDGGMKRLIIATDSYPYAGGEKPFLLSELKRLSREYEIVVLSHASQSIPEQEKDRDLPQGIRVVRFPRPVIGVKEKAEALIRYVFDRDCRCEVREICRGKKLRKERIYQSLSFFAQTLSDQKMLHESRLLQTECPVVYYSFWYTYYCNSAVREARGNANVKVVTRAHGYDLYAERIPGNRQPFKHQMERNLSKILFVCESTKAYYIKNIKGNGIQEEQLLVNRLGVEKAEGYPEKKQGKEWELLSCSNVIPLKRIERIIEGLSRVDRYAIHWVHIGAGEQFEWVRQYAQKMLGEKANIRVEFKGSLDNTEVKKYYGMHSIDAFITTSSTEGCPVSIQEAMSYQIPIIATNVGGIPEMVQGNGILLSEDPSAEEVAEAIERLAGLSEDKRQELRRNSYALWKRDYDAMTNSEELSKIIGSLFSDKAV